jgi:hypothetical protein
MDSLKISAWLALVLSVVGVFAKVARYMWQHEWWPFFLYDYIAVVLLVIGALMVLRSGAGGRWLAAGWGFGAAMSYGSFFGHLHNWTNRIGSDLSFERTMSYSVGVLLIINVIGLALTLWRPSRVKSDATPLQVHS